MQIKIISLSFGTLSWIIMLELHKEQEGSCQDLSVWTLHVLSVYLVSSHNPKTCMVG